ncbi:MAG: hypothetical protein D6753_03270 [Planctomycetota bacterium]|nr:MAG: hypothetical protein D6753_03270 [Planctomycetota bacterium]
MEWLNHLADALRDGWHTWTNGRTWAVVLGTVFALLAVLLFALSRTRWGRAKPLTKFVVISVLLHVWLLMYALGTRPILPQGDPRGREQTVAVAIEFYSPEQESTNSPTTAPSNLAEVAHAPPEPAEPPDVPADVRMPSLELPDLLPSPEVEQEAAAAEPEPDTSDQSAVAVPEPSVGEAHAESPSPVLPPSVVPPAKAETASAAASTVASDFDEPVLPELPPENLLAETGSTPVLPADSASPPASPPAPDGAGDAASSGTLPNSASPTLRPLSYRQSVPLHPVVDTDELQRIPDALRLRQSPQRWPMAQAYGADEDTEAAVAAALRWLAGTQAADGSWVAAEHGGGTEMYVFGENRHGTGRYADTGVTGLALLAFLGAGHTHLDGEYHQVVRNGLEYLLAVQMPSGDLAGPKQIGTAPVVLNARMYCHGIAALALSEALAMTSDPALREAVQRAVHYTINAQDPRGGGWRYMPGDSGDLSQFGWQAMALHSARRAGIAVPGITVTRMRRFLDACATGRHAGLARYRPGEGRPSPTMTAEALACRLMLQIPLDDAARREATAMILQHQPGSEEDNLYYWYCATMALFQLQDANWRTWNHSLKRRLLTTQRSDAPMDGSWDPDRLWGGYGGRIFSTALSCMCLEVYYRYLPMYAMQEANRRPLQPLSPPQR